MPRRHTLWLCISAVLLPAVLLPAVLLPAVLLPAVLLPAPILAAGGPELCVVSELDTADFSAVYHQPVPSFGCSSQCVTAEGHEVHAVRLSTKYSSRDTPSPEERPKVVLNVLPPGDGVPFSAKVVLFLAASSSVDWSVFGRDGLENSTSFQIIVTRESAVARTNLPSVSVTSQAALQRDALLTAIPRQLGCVTSFTDVTVANLIDLTVGTAADAPDLCDAHKGLQLNSGLSAYLQRTVDLNGCYHRHLTGIGQRDVYVVEVAETGRAFSDSDVILHLSPADATKRLSSNITLLLKAAVPVTWSLVAERFSGDVLVVTEFPVLNSSLDRSVSLKVKVTRLPDSFNDLIIYAVGYSSGPPVAYLRSLAVSRINIGLRAGAADGAEHETSAFELPNKTPGKGAPNAKRNMRRPKMTGPSAAVVSSSLRRSLSVSCTQGRLVVAVPADAADGVFVSALRLADPTCRSFRNTSHLVISEPLDDCDTQRRVVRGKAVYVNSVYFMSPGAPPDDEDFEGSGSGLGLPELWDGMAVDSDRAGMVPVSCSHPDRASPEVVLSQGRRHQEDPLGAGEVDSSEYTLDLFADELFVTPIEPNALVPIAHNIYARAGIHIAPYLRPAVEQCWISKDSDAHAPYKFLIVRTACPVDGSVKFVRSQSGDSELFTFQVSRQYLELGPFYLHCRIGVCAPPDSAASRHIAQCVDRDRYCADTGWSGARPVASGVQVASRGPLLPTVSDTAVEVPRWPAGPLIRLGVEPETVVAIGAAAFVLGILLMGGVWLIHSKIGPSKRRQFQAVPQNPTVDTCGQSTNSTPNSQTPIIV